MTKFTKSLKFCIVLLATLTAFSCSQPKLLDIFTYELNGTTEDPTYGYTELNPIKVGNKGKDSHYNQLRYINALRDTNGHEIAFKDLGMCCQGLSSRKRRKKGMSPLHVFEITYDSISKPKILFVSISEYEPLYAPVHFSFEDTPRIYPQLLAEKKKWYWPFKNSKQDTLISNNELALAQNQDLINPTDSIVATDSIVTTEEIIDETPEKIKEAKKKFRPEKFSLDTPESMVLFANEVQFNLITEEEDIASQTENIIEKEIQKQLFRDDKLAIKKSKKMRKHLRKKKSKTKSPESMLQYASKIELKLEKVEKEMLTASEKDIEHEIEKQIEKELKAFKHSQEKRNHSQKKAEEIVDQNNSGEDLSQTAPSDSQNSSL